jgi:hypothetical protein
MKKLTLLTAALLMAAINAGCGGGGGHGWAGQIRWKAAYGVLSAGNYGFQAAAMGSASTVAALKKAITRGATGGAPHASSLDPVRAAAVNTASVSTALWNSSLKYIYLNWEPLSGASDFTVYYLGPDGTQNEQVWPPPDGSPEDPDYNSSDPAVYLDLSVELAGLVKDPGSYQFRLTASKGSETKQSTITVSIGTILNQCPAPANPLYISSRLNWSAVTAAPGYTVGYTVGIYKDSFTSANEIWRTPAAIPDLFVTLPPSGVTMTPGDDYLCSINARAVDTNGKIVEITNATSGFDY